MPTYEYHCLDCDNAWERTEHIAEHERVTRDDGTHLRCPRCNGDHVDQLLSTFFARTDRKS